MTLPIVALIVSLLFYTACVAVEPTTNFSDSPKPSQKDLDLAERYLKNHLQSAPRNLVGRIKPQSIDSFRTWIERQEQRDQVGNVCENIVPVSRQSFFKVLLLINNLSSLETSQ